MRKSRVRSAFSVLLASGVLCLAIQSPALGQSEYCVGNQILHRDHVLASPQRSASGPSAPETDALPEAVRGCDASADTDLQKRTATADPPVPKAIVIGFVGGFVSQDDQKHPEVQFAEYLQNRYHSNVYAEVFGNHHGKKALHTVMRLLDADSDGALTPAEKEQARIILYGHSWGGAEAVLLARELGKRGIPVLLTIQVDAVSKPGRNILVIPPSVSGAVNFYQTRGPIHGRSAIVAADPARTQIIGNFLMTYDDFPVNCDNYPWYARKFNKPHHEIENDPRVWNHAASLIDAALTGTSSAEQASASWKLRPN